MAISEPPPVSPIPVASSNRRGPRPEFTITGEGFSPLESVREMWQHRTLVSELVRRDLKTRYRKRIGGVLWSLASPLLQVLTITLMVKFFFANPVSDYSAYLMVIMFLWVFFQNTVLDASASILQNAALVRKIYFPRAVLPIVTSLTNAFHFAVSFGFTLCYLFALRTYPQHLRWEFLLVIPVTFFAWICALGVGYLMAYLTNLYEDVRFIMGVGFGLLFYALPILYPIERVAAQPGIYNLYMLNPMAALMVTFQRAVLSPPEVLDGSGKVLPAIGIPWAHFGLACVSSVLLLTVGFLCFERYKWAIMERI